MNAQRIPRVAAPVAMILAFLLVLAGCSSSSGGDRKGAGNTDVATGGERFGTADADTAKLGTDAAPGVFPRTIKHANGETTLEKKPTRIVVLDTGELDDVLTLGVTPVGMVTTKGANPVPSYLAGRVRDVPSVGEINALDLEAIAELEPDLILGSKLRADNLYPTLAKIAPTVFSIRPGFPWKENFRLVGTALGMEKQTVDTLNTYADHAKALKTEVTGNPTISLLRFMSGRTRLYGNKSLIGVILQDAGLARPTDQNVAELAVEISRENLAKADGDYLFYTSYGTPAATAEQAVLGSPGWQQLGAVRNHKAFRVDDDVWFLGLGPTGANLIVDQLGGFLAH
ncbi:iron-siderophore ABC transporter substrate-binding protein [Tsukamurella sp. 8F]|uniref:ABC transporter substrate-binding protein n=1 Tax=unclassified Tsukamurella TaxID=2633480 RepID=UPI0023B8DCA4|nr:MULTISPECIES: iron-siderophore ABC transporter substrate-binding protein [unclassified Tsukamurella]MDF0531790.1 iron-siderophore ABC transporter substrate-binding protein [Tsukamurella sp. 8J]MDF0589032.1 iron-siderophore ABC transporter substrate-binding protein [Tsukamurella sp. 8F]